MFVLLRRTFTTRVCLFYFGGPLLHLYVCSTSEDVYYTCLFDIFFSECLFDCVSDGATQKQERVSEMRFLGAKADAAFKNVPQTGCVKVACYCKDVKAIKDVQQPSKKAVPSNLVHSLHGLLDSPSAGET